jgi:hypothetical protein
MDPLIAKPWTGISNFPDPEPQPSCWSRCKVYVCRLLEPSQFAGILNPDAIGAGSTGLDFACPRVFDLFFNYLLQNAFV